MLFGFVQVGFQNPKEASMTKSARRTSDPFVKRSTLRYLTRGETPSVRAVALQLHFGMVTALREGDGAIHASWKEIADWAGVSYASVKRAAIRLRELGWVRELPGRGITFNYKRSTPAEKAQIEPRSNRELETLREECNHPNAVVPTVVMDLPPSGEDALSQEPGREVPPVPSVFSAAVGVLVGAGADRAGAVAAVRTARKANTLDLGTLQRIVASVACLPISPRNSGGLLCAAVRRPELGQKLIRDAAWADKKRGSTQNRRGDCNLAKVEVMTPVVERQLPKLNVVSRWDAMLQDVRRLLEFESEDREWVVKAAMGKGWDLDALRAIPELRGWDLCAAWRTGGCQPVVSPLAGPRAGHGGLGQG